MVNKMQIKTTEGEKSVASAGVGGAGLGLGIAGTALGLLNGGAFNLGGLFNNGASYNNDSRIISALESKISKLESEKYTDDAQLDLRDRIASLNEKVIGYVIDIDKRLSAIEVAGPLREQLIQQQITCCCNSANAAITALQNTVNNITKTVIPGTAVCPEYMPRYNSWTAPTTTTASNG